MRDSRNSRRPLDEKLDELEESCSDADRTSIVVVQASSGTRGSGSSKWRAVAGIVAAIVAVAEMIRSWWQR